VPGGEGIGVEAAGGSRLTEKVRVEEGAGPIGRGGGWIAKLDTKVEAEGAEARGEGWARFWAEVEVEVEAVGGAEAKRVEGTLEEVEGAGGQFIWKVEVEAKAERGAEAEDTLEGARGLREAEETLEGAGAGLEGVGGARFAAKVEVKAGIWVGAGVAKVEGDIRFIWKEPKAGAGAGRAGADGRFIGFLIKPEEGPPKELKAGAGVAGAEIEVEDEA
jgi:hypothetical protein